MYRKEDKDSLEAFAKRVETRIRAGMAGSDSMERLICRLLTGNDAKVAAHLAMKWVEWRHGKPTEKIEHSGNINLTGIIEKARKRATD